MTTNKSPTKNELGDQSTRNKLKMLMHSRPLETHPFFHMVGPLNGLGVLDYGSGMGDYSQQCKLLGASKVTAVDNSFELIAIASKQKVEGIQYIHMNLFDPQLPPEDFDCIISSLKLQCFADLETLFANLYSWLRPGGKLVFSIPHPIRTASSSKKSTMDTITLADYFTVRGVSSKGDEPLIHHPLANWLKAITKSGFTLKEFSEPAATIKQIEKHPGLATEVALPTYALFSCVK